MSSASNSPFPMGSAPGTLEVVEAVDGEVVCFILAGEMDLSTAPGVPVRVRDAIRHGARNVCVDLTAVSFMDSTGLAALLNCRRAAARGNGHLAVVHNGGEVLRLLELSRIDRALELHTSRSTALAALASRNGNGGAPSQ